MTRRLPEILLALSLTLPPTLLTGVEPAVAASGAQLSEEQQQKLDTNWKLSLTKEKGPYTQNFCVCKNGQKKPVMLPDGSIVSPCGGSASFCAAFREPWAQALAEERVYIANLFARDLWLWDEFPDHHDLVRGYILEKFFFETNPDHKLAQMRAYGGLAGAEFEARDAPLFFEKYLALEDFDEPRYYLLAYELQRRFFVRDDQGQIVNARNLASAIQRQKPNFKPLRDAVHNQISANLIPKLVRYGEKLPAGDTRDRLDELISEIRKLTSLDESALREQLSAIENETVRSRIAALVPPENAQEIQAIAGLATVMRAARMAVEKKSVSPSDRRKLIDLAITAAAVIQQRGMRLLEGDTPLTARQHVALLIALTDSAYGSGLLLERERATVSEGLRKLLDAKNPSREEVKTRLAEAARVVEWSQHGTLYAFEEVRAPWTQLVPQTHLLPDDVLRGSPLMVYAKALERLDDWAAGGDPILHQVFGKDLDRGVRALNPGLALGKLRVAPASGDYSREEVLALAETPADLDPAAGILTQGEGNVVSHVQLLARSLGIPNVVLDATAYQLFGPVDQKNVFYVVTPGGRVIVKEASAMTDRDRAAVAEFTRSEERNEDGSLGNAAKKLHIDVDRIDLDAKLAMKLAGIRRADSGIRGGPKAAYLGELKHLFPDKVARGIVVPFGAYYDHYRRARVRVPAELADQGIATAGGALHEFVEQTYATFFNEMMTSETSEQDLSAWIRPRLDVMRASIQAEPISDALQESIRGELSRQGMLRQDDPSQTVGVFVRSDTNVEDLDDFNGAGLNLTLFNRRSLDDVFSGLKEVWASPFTYRSFSWRQALIDQPLWVLPSVVILESVSTVKSGVLVTTDVDRGDDTAMLVATSEGVGGAVDGSPAETLIWSPRGVEIVTLFKSPWRRLLQPEGGSAIVDSTGSEYVLSETELKDLVSTAATLRDRLAPALDGEGRPRPWDIEFGFAEGKLWLFQVRPFLGNDSLKNVPALAGYEAPPKKATPMPSLDEILR